VKSNVLGSYNKTYNKTSIDKLPLRMDYVEYDTASKTAESGQRMRIRDIETGILSYLETLECPASQNFDFPLPSTIVDFRSWLH